MSSVRSKDFGIFLAKQFRESVSEPSSSNLYFTFGKAQPWTNDLSPPQANTADVTVYEVWKNMIGAKRITGNDIRHVVPRFNWTNNTVYYAYSAMTDSKTLKNENTPFYVLTDDFNVYKCIANNGGNVSSSKPGSTNPSGQFQTPDKYVWKYMYSIPAEDQERFLTDTFMPVRTLVVDDNTLQWQVQDNAVEGTINDIIVVNGGTGYTTNNITVNVTGDGIFANAFARINGTSQKIQTITIDNKGFGYTFANVTFKSATGSNASARVVISPPGGHGSDPLSELGGSYLLIDVRMNGDEGGFLTVQNDFRQLAVIENPLVFSSSNLMSNAVTSQLTTISLSESSSTFNYYEDEWVYQGKSLANATFKGVVVDWDFSNASLKLSNVQGIPTADLLTGNTSTTARYVSSIVNPDMTPYSGKLLYINNITPIERSSDQNEEFKILLSF